MQLNTTKKELDELTYRIIGGAIEVYKALGPGLLESVYQKMFKTGVLSSRIKIHFRISCASEL